jgi:PUA domain protein
MAAGIHAADAAVESGDLVWIRDQEHKRPLALGWACMDAAEMISATKGKAVRTLHWVGDELWSMEF